MINRTENEPDREALYEEVWANPVSVVAERYGLSDVGLAKICRKLVIPLPSRGYWAKIKAGKVMHRVPLPILKGNPAPLLTLKKLSETQVASHHQAKTQASEVKHQLGVIQVPGELTAPHPLVKAASKRLWQRNGWSGENGIRNAPGEVLDLAVTPASLDRAIRLIDTLLKELEKLSVTVSIDSKNKCTLLDAQGTLFKLQLSEKVRRSNHEETPAEKKARDRYYASSRLGLSGKYPDIPRFDYKPTGVLTITAGHWPSRSWNDTERTPLEKRLGEVLAGILALGLEIRAKDAEEARQRELKRLAVERYQAAKARLDAEREKFQQLELETANWEKAMKVRAYVDAVEQQARAEGLVPKQIQDWILWARAKADWMDPLIQVCDPILDAPEPKAPGHYW